MPRWCPYIPDKKWAHIDMLAGTGESRAKHSSVRTSWGTCENNTIDEIYRKMFGVVFLLYCVRLGSSMVIEFPLLDTVTLIVNVSLWCIHKNNTSVRPVWLPFIHSLLLMLLLQPLLWQTSSESERCETDRPIPKPLISGVVLFLLHQHDPHETTVMHFLRVTVAQTYKPHIFLCFMCVHLPFSWWPQQE